jgi:hypothetical protein
MDLSDGEKASVCLTNSVGKRCNTDFTSNEIRTALINENYVYVGQRIKTYHSVHLREAMLTDEAGWTMTIQCLRSA